MEEIITEKEKHLLVNMAFGMTPVGREAGGRSAVLNGEIDQTAIASSSTEEADVEVAF